MLNCISYDHGNSWRHVDGKGILVLQPGAGTYMNRRAYRELDRYKVIEFDREHGFIYPPNWQDNQTIVLPKSGPTTDDLAGYAKIVGKEIHKHPPEVLICGSRGSQVTIGLIWKHFWRGPTVVINAGCITSNTKIPRPVYPIFITMEEDYFKTNDIKYVQERFKKSSRVEGWGYHLNNEGHMPNLKGILKKAVEAAMNREKPERIRGSIKIYKLVPEHNRKIIKKTKKRSKLSFKLKNPVHNNTLLRTDPSSSRNFVYPKIPNGTKVYLAGTMSHTGMATDEKGYAMLRVRHGDIIGWVYQRNIISAD